MDKTPLPNNTFRVYGAIDSRYRYTIHNSRGEMLAYGYRTYEAALAAADQMLKAYKAKRKARKITKI